MTAPRPMSAIDDRARWAVACGLEYAANIAARLGRRTRPVPDLTGLRILELGPGPDFGPILICHAMGAEVAVLDKQLVTWDDAFHPEFYRKLLDEAKAATSGAGDWTGLEAIIAAGYHLTSVVWAQPGDMARAPIPFDERMFDAVISNAALEHSWDPTITAVEMARVTRPGGVGIHQIDYRDHRDFARPLDFLALSDSAYSALCPDVAAVCGSRVRHAEMMSAVLAAGFAIDEERLESFADDEMVRALRPNLAPRFARMSDSDVRVLGAKVFLRRGGLEEPDADKKNTPAQKTWASPPRSASAAVIGAAAPSDIAIRVRHLSKMYKVYPRPSAILREMLFRKPAHVEHWALRDVSFDVKHGEIVGIVGANGAGKSTLLQMLAGTLEPTAGTFEIAGRLRAILQLGTGFHPEYTGRENIYMGGYCMGYSRAEIDESLEWILDFSGLEDVIDQPFRTYSTGMKGRLTFAVTFCRKPEVLIVDEALATGDVAFRQKCTNHIVELCSGGATALVVSHSSFMIETLCSRSLYLKHGRLVADGVCRDVTRLYERQMLDEFARETERKLRRAAVAIAPIMAEAGVANHVPAAVPEKSTAQSEIPHERISPTPATPVLEPALIVVTRGALEHPAPSVAPFTPTNLPAESGNGAAARSGAAPTNGTSDLDPETAALLADPEGVCPPILHLNLVRLAGIRVLGIEGDERKMFECGEPMIVEVDLDSRIEKDNVVLGVQVFHESGVHVTTTTNRVHHDERGRTGTVRLDLRRGAQTFRIEFDRLFLAGGNYYLNIGLSPKPRHFTEADQLLRENRVAVFHYRRSDFPRRVLYDPPSRWSVVVRRGIAATAGSSASMASAGRPGKK